MKMGSVWKEIQNGCNHESQAPKYRPLPNAAGNGISPRKRGDTYGRNIWGSRPAYGEPGGVVPKKEKVN